MGHLRPHFEKNEKWCRAVIEKMTPQEHEMFYLDMKKVDWNITLRDMYKNIFNEFIH